MNENRLKKLSQWAKTNATECIFPFWTSEYIMDQENGGFYGVVTLDMQRNNSEPRGLTLTGRMLYAFSTAYRVLGDDIYRQRAAYTFHELVTRFYDPEYGGAFTTVTEKGEVLTTDKPNYCEAFLIMGCAAYYHATGDTEALRIAMETFHIMETKVKYAPACYHGNMTRDFQVADGFGFGRKGSKSPFPPDAIVFPHHLCQAYLRLYQATGDPEVGAALRDMVCAVVSSLYDAQYNAEARSQGDVAFTIHEPLGVFANIVPFNYPVELAAHKLAPMLVTGNSVVLLPSSKTPRTAIVIVEQLIKAGVPAKAVPCVTGRGSVIGAAAAADPRVAAVSFTGSTEVGISLAETCAKSLRPVSLELGGNDPLIIFDDCDYALALDEAINGRIGNAGQTCCASKRFLVQRGIYDRFTSDLADRLTKVKMGNPSDPTVILGPCIRESAAITVEAQIAKTVAQGGRLVCGGKRSGAFIEPTVIQVRPDMEIARDMEVFGPVWPIIPFDTMEEALAIVNQTRFGLSSGVITSNIKTAMQVANGIEAGACIINGTGNYRLAHQPFGGYKYSGVGREGAVCTLEEVTQQKLISFKGILNR